jgi:hypothetical protein
MNDDTTERLDQAPNHLCRGGLPNQRASHNAGIADDAEYAYVTHFEPQGRVVHPLL